MDTPLAELLLARGLVGRPILAEALDHVRGSREQDRHLSLAVFLLERSILAPDVIDLAGLPRRYHAQRVAAIRGR